jgi:hypothetical protein
MAFMIRSFKWSYNYLPPTDQDPKSGNCLCTRVYPGSTRRVVVIAETNHPIVNESQLREIARTHLVYENEKIK